MDKPVGITSFDVIRRLQKEHREGKLFNLILDTVQGANEACDQDVSGNKMREQTSAATQKCAKTKLKMGHAGTLDPAASGLMLIGVGEGTKQLTQLTKLDKEYEAEILIGTKTDSGDREGQIIEEKDIESREEEEIFSAEKISSALQRLVGTIELPVSAYSAIKKGGVPFYKKAHAAAREGRVIPEAELPRREMTVYNAVLDGPVEYNEETKRIIIPAKFHVASGTYIRSLAEELGKLLGNYPASLINLRRTKVGEFDIKDARKI